MYKYQQSWSNGVERKDLEQDDDDYDNIQSISLNPKIALEKIKKIRKLFKVTVILFTITMFIILGIGIWVGFRFINEESTTKKYFDNNIEKKILEYQAEKKLVTDKNINEIVSNLAINNGINDRTSQSILTFLNDLIVNGRLSQAELNNNYVEKDFLDALLSGRLSENVLDNKYALKNDFNNLKTIIDIGRLSEDVLNNKYALKAQVNTLDPRYASALKVNDLEALITNGRLSEENLINTFVSRNDYDATIVNGRLSQLSLTNTFVSRNDYDATIVNGRLSESSINEFLKTEKFLNYYNFLSESEFTNNEHMHYVPTLIQANKKLYFSFTYNESNNPIIIELTSLSFSTSLKKVYFYSDNGYILTNQYDPQHNGIQIVISYIKVSGTNLISARITKAGSQFQNELTNNFSWKVKGGKYSIYVE